MDIHELLVNRPLLLESIANNRYTRPYQIGISVESAPLILSISNTGKSLKSKPILL
jgi:hypothetical protein